MPGRNAGVLLIVLLALAPAALAGVGSSQSGWYAGNPPLGLADLEDVACAGTTCYASGAFGTLLRSDDAGATWSGLVTGVTDRLAHVRLAGGDPQRVVAGGGCSLLRSDDGGQHFTLLPFTAGGGRCASPIVAFSFPTSDTGYVLTADGSVLATSDGGKSFTRKASAFPGIPGSTEPEVNDLACTSETRCFVALVQSGIARSDDGGGSWTQVGSASDDGKVVISLNAISFADANDGYVAGSGMLMTTTDGGNSWQRRPTDADLSSAACDAVGCLFATRAGDRVLRTTDGGATLTPVDASADPVFGLGFAPGGRALAVGSGASVALSDDDGASWQSGGGRLSATYRVLRAVSSTVAFAAGNGGALAVTHDAGQTWQALGPRTVTALADVASPDGGTTVYLLDTAGGLERSGNAGESWQLLNTGGRRALALLAQHPGQLLLVGRHFLAISRDGGRSFRTVTPRLARADSLTSADGAAGALFAYGPHTLLRSTDGGRSWEHLQLPPLQPADELRRVDFVGPNYGYLLTTLRKVFKTHRAGRDWSQLLDMGGGGDDLAFSDPLHGYVSVPGYAYRYDGAVLRTSNGGLTWRPQIVSPAFVRGLASSGSTDYALAGDDGLYATRAGGDAGSPALLTLHANTSSITQGRHVTLTGRLSPHGGGEPVVISAYSRGRWISRVVTTAGDGSFSTSWKPGETIQFVAQALGDADRSAAGTRALTVRVTQRQRK